MTLLRQLATAGFIALAALPVVPAGAVAQDPPPPGGRGGPPPGRPDLERRARQAYGRALRDRLGLTPDQMRKLGDLNRRLAQPRHELMQEEREVRRTLVEQVRADSAADQQKISAALDRLHALERRRVDLMEQEDKGLAEFMSPLQRAKYRALQELLRRRIQGGGPRPMPGGGGGGGGGGPRLP